MRTAHLHGIAMALGAAVLLAFAPAGAVAQDYAKIVAAEDRSEADRKNDGRREAVKLLEFTGAKTGWRVLDMGAGGGYSTELMARSVGSTGRVWAQNAAPSERLTTRLATPAMAGVVNLVRPFDDPLPGDVRELDLITFFFAYHDTTFMPVDRAKMNKAMFDALKPGGHLVIADHSAKPEDGAAVGKSLHRIAERTLREEIEAAGFRLIASGDFLRNPSDPRDVSVHRSGIRNDEFVLKFEKPR